MNIVSIGLALATAYLLVVVLWTLWSTRRQRRTLGPSQYRTCERATRLVGRSSERNRTRLVLSSLAVILGALILRRDLHGLSGVASMAAALSLIVGGIGLLVRARTPASILVLGASGDEAVTLHAAIRDAVTPFRPVSFLEEPIDTLSLKRQIPGDCLRMGDRSDWRNCVYGMARALPLVVLDARNLTPLVREEIDYIAEHNLTYKTVVIATDNVDVTFASPGRGNPASQSMPPVMKVSGQHSVTGVLRYVLFERQSMPTVDEPLTAVAKERAGWPGAGEAAGSRSTATSKPSNRNEPGMIDGDTCVELAGLAPFAYRRPDGWKATVLATARDRYAVLFRPPDESGARNFLRRRSRLDFMVFKYTDATVQDVAAFRHATDVNLKQHGATITREKIGQRHGVMSHECFFEQGVSAGYLVRFIVAGNEYLVHWTSTDGQTMRRHLSVVERFVDQVKGNRLEG